MTANKNIAIVSMSSTDYQNVHNVKREDFSEVQLVLNPDPERSPSGKIVILYVSQQLL